MGVSQQLLYSSAYYFVFTSKMFPFLAVIFLTFFLEIQALSISTENVANPAEG